jgi:hypothetical protein
MFLLPSMPVERRNGADDEVNAQIRRLLLAFILSSFFVLRLLFGNRATRMMGSTVG